MRVALDTNRYSDLRNMEPTITAIVESAEQVYLPFVVVAELRAGFLIGTRRHENETRLMEFLSKSGVSVLYPDDATTRHYADIYHYLRTRGNPIPVNDLWIAAIVIQHGLTLCSRDSHFNVLPQIMRI